MAEDYEILAKYGDENCKLVFNQTFSLLDKGTEINLQLPASVLNWKMKILFVDDLKWSEGNTNLEIEDSVIIFRLNKWNGSHWMENVQPLLVESLSKIKFYFKISSNARIEYNVRSLTISIWKVII